MSLDVPPGSPWRGQGFLLGLSLVLGLVALFMVWPYRGAIVFALVLGYLLQPLYRWLHPKVRWRPVAGGLILLLVTLALVVPFVIIGASLAQEARDVGTALSEGNFRTQLAGWLQGVGIPQERAEPALGQIGSAVSSYLEGSALDLVLRTVDFLIGLLIFFILLYFLIVDGDRISAYLRRVSPLDRKRSERFLARIGGNTRSILLGSILVSAIQGVAAGLGWWFFGFPQPVFWGFVMTVLAVLPFAGPFFVLVPAGVIAILQGNLFGGIGILVYGIVLVGLVDDVVRPYVIGKRAGVHPAIILIGILGGVAVFGATGFILGPLLLSLLPLVVEATVAPENEPLAPADEG